MTALRTLLLTAGALATAACSLAPGYQPLAVAIPQKYKEVPGWQPAGTAVAAPGKWWEAFRDPVLSSLAERIERGNFDLAQATARYEQARALVGEARADRFPQIDLNAAGARERVAAGRPLSTSGRATTYSVGTIGASLAYEIDLFGRVRNNVRASEAEAQASASDVAAVRLGLQAQLATAYFDMRGLDARIVLLRQTADAFQRAFNLTSTRHEGGIASGIDVARAQNQLSSARAELSAVEIDRQRDEHAIAVLVGGGPSNFTLPVAGALIPPPVVPAGLPSTLLERRPDIAAAERRVAAANARIGVARAAWFPALTLGASGGFETTHGNILSTANSFWALGPLGAVLNLFDGGRRRAQVRLARAQFDEAAAAYRQTVLVAFREVEDDLAAQRLLARQQADQAQASAAAERARDLALIRYRDGAADYLEVVTAQTAALDAQRALLTVRSQQLEIATDAFRALGGDIPSI